MNALGLIEVSVFQCLFIVLLFIYLNLCHEIFYSVWYRLKSLFYNLNTRLMSTRPVLQSNHHLIITEVNG